MFMLLVSKINALVILFIIISVYIYLLPTNYLLIGALMFLLYYFTYLLKRWNYYKNKAERNYNKFLN
jgi:hypothetical protein